MARVSRVGLRCSYGMPVWAAPTHEFIFEVTVLASVSSFPRKLQFVIRGAVSLTGGFLRVLGILAFLA